MTTQFEFQALGDMLGALQRRVLEVERISPVFQAIPYDTIIEFPEAPSSSTQDTGYIRRGGEFTLWFSVSFDAPIALTARSALGIIDLPFPVQRSRSAVGGCIGTWHLGLGGVVMYSGTVSPHPSDPRRASLHGPLPDVTLDSIEGMVSALVEPGSESGRLPRA